MDKVLPVSVVGVYPKPDYLPTPVWYSEGEGQFTCTLYNEFITGLSETEREELDKTLEKAQKEVIEKQTTYGIDVITDGEVYRDVYIYHFLRQCENVDFANPEMTVYRNGACQALLPVITGPVSVKPEKIGFMADIWEKCQKLTDTPVKVTMPGPMTITNTTVRRFFKTEEDSCKNLAECLKTEIAILVERGCKHIQIDEPLFARKTDAALGYGIDLMSSILNTMPEDVFSTVHICCGYTDLLDQEDFQKANPESYTILSDRLDKMGASAISMEGAFCNLDLQVLSKYKETRIMLGVIAVCKSRVESVQEIKERIREAVTYMSADRLILGPDCGLGMLPKECLHQKLTNLMKAAKEMRDELSP